MGLISIVIAVAPAVGPTFSGFVLNSLSWRWMFLSVLPLAVIALVAGAILVKDFSTRSSARFDVLSILLSAIAFGGLIYGLSSIGESVSGNAVISPWIPIGVGLLSLLLFVLRQLRLQRHDGALLDLRPFRERNFTLGTIMLMITMAAMFGALILLPIYLQQVLGLDTLQTGLALLPGGLAMGIIAPFIGRAFDKWGPRPLIIPGSFIVAIALSSMYLFTANTPVGQVIATHVTFSIGMGMVMTPLLTATLGSLRTELYSHGSAIANTLQQLAGAAGTALFITMMTTGATLAARNGTGELASMAAGIHGAFIWGGILALGSAVLSFFIRNTPAATKTP